MSENTNNKPKINMPRFNLSWLYVIIAMSFAILYFSNQEGGIDKQITYTEFKDIQDDNQVTKQEESEEQKSSEKDDLENQLTSILKEINGSGDVSVMITYDNSQEIEPAYNSSSTKETTSETDSSGGERTVETASENKTLVTSDSSNPIVIKTKEAKIKGVLVVASGASDPQIKQTLYEAVQTALQIS